MDIPLFSMPRIDVLKYFRPSRERAEGEGQLFPLSLQRRWYGSAFMLIFVMIIIFFSFATYSRNRIYEDNIRFWEDAVRTSPHKARSHYNLGDAYLDAGRSFEAMREFYTAVNISPNNAQAHFNRGWMFHRLGQLDQAIAAYDMAITLDPSYVKAYNNRGVVFLKMERYDEALQDFDKVLSINPSDKIAASNRLLIFSHHR